MDEEEKDRNDEKQVNERGGHMEDDECPNPHEEQNKRDGKKYKSHQNPFYSAIIARFSRDSLVRPHAREALGPHSGE